jgi:hypothetical protein
MARRTCPTCNGTGRRICVNCNGKGCRYCSRGSFVCNTCGGSGTVED